MSGEEHKKPDKIQAFDSLFTNNHIQMYKILLPYFESPMQKHIAIYIKYMELQYTISYFRLHPYASIPRDENVETVQICRELLPFCSSSEKESMEKIMEMLANFKNAQEMMETINMMKELFPEGFSFGDGDGSSPDFMQMFQMFGKQ